MTLCWLPSGRLAWTSLVPWSTSPKNPIPSKQSSTLRRKIQVKLVSVNGIGHTCHDRTGQRHNQLIQQRFTLARSQSGSGRSPYFWQGFKAVALSALQSRSIGKVSSSCTSDSKRNAELNGQTKCDTSGHGVANSQDTSICDREKMRRHRISVANKGKVPWNKGGKHSAETIKRIKERTSQAMNRPTVMAKLKMNPRHSQTPATRTKIRDKLRQKWDDKKIIWAHQESMLKHWRYFVAEAARVGVGWEEELEWESYFILKEMMRQKAQAIVREERMMLRKAAKVKTSGKSEEHRQKISDAIRAKWEDPEYQLKVLKGMKKRIDVESRPRRIVSARSPQSPRARASRTKAGVILKPLDHGFVTAVMLGEKRRYASESQTKDQSLSFEQQPRFRNFKVDLLKKSNIPADQPEQKDLEQDTIALNDMPTPSVSVSPAHSFVDPFATDKLNKLKQLQLNRVMMGQKRKEAVEQARLLIAEAEKAAKALEAIAGDNESALISLTETHRIIEEATLFMQRAESVNQVADSNIEDGGLWNSTTSHLQVKWEEQPNEPIVDDSDGKIDRTV